MKKFSILLLLILGLIFITQTELGHILRQGDVDAIAHYMKGYGSTAMIISFLFIFVQAFFPYMPFIVLAGVNVLLFGLYPGFIISWLATSIGSIFAFLTARYMARDWAEHKVKQLKLASRFHSLTKEIGFVTIFLFRVTALVPSSIVNLTAGISRIKLKTFIAATLLGNLPITFAESWLGHWIIHIKSINGLFIIVILLFLGAAFYWRKKRKRF